MHEIISLMRITAFHLRDFRRFNDLTVSSIPADTRLVVMAGPNGIGKSSVLDGFKVWQGRYIGGVGADTTYYNRFDASGNQLSNSVELTFDRDLGGDTEVIRRAIYVRSAYRNEPDFVLTGFSSLPQIIDLPKSAKMIDQESTVSQNYQQLVGQTVAGVFDTANDAVPVAELRERLIGQVRESMRNVFGDLLLQGIADPITSGTFYFQKGGTKGWALRI